MVNNMQKSKNYSVMIIKLLNVILMEYSTHGNSVSKMKYDRILITDANRYFRSIIESTPMMTQFVIKITNAKKYDFNLAMGG